MKYRMVGGRKNREVLRSMSIMCHYLPLVIAVSKPGARWSQRTRVRMLQRRDVYMQTNKQY